MRVETPSPPPQGSSTTCYSAPVANHPVELLSRIVAEDCCGDPGEAEHAANLKDMGRRYTDIVNSDEVVRYLEDIRGRNT